MSFRIMPQFLSAAFFIYLYVLSGVGFASEDSLEVFAYGGQPNAGFMAVPQKSLTGIWNLKGKKDASYNQGPVAVWFHGGMTSGNCGKGLEAGGDLGSMLPNFVVVSVSACKQNHWVTPVAVGWVDAALDSIAARRGSTVDKVYMLGISDGALGVIAYSLWGRRQIVSRVLISSYGASFGDAREIAAQPRLQAGRWRFIQGGSDRLYPAEVTVPWITQFCDGVDRGGGEKAAVRCDLKFDPAGEHDWGYWKGRRLDWVLEVFKEK